MRRSLVDLLVDPATKRSLVLEEPETTDNGRIVSGRLRSDTGGSFPISNGIPRFVRSQDGNQDQVSASFGFKWSQQKSYGSEAFQAWYRSWLMQRYGFASEGEMRSFFGPRHRILEAGCGSGLSASISLSGAGGGQEWIGVDISSAIDLARARLGEVPNAEFVQADVLDPPFRENTFDVVFAEGVLHHTPSTERALRALVSLLEPGGEIMFYVYRKKAPVREFTDDHIRAAVSDLDPAEAWEALRPLTMLGRALVELRAEVDVPEEIPYLGIKAGRYDVQRLLYWHFAKAFWNPAFSFEENLHINFDWYHPSFAHRHTEEEIRRWCDEANLSIVRFCAQESGFTVRAVKG